MSNSTIYELGNVEYMGKEPSPKSDYPNRRAGLASKRCRTVTVSNPSLRWSAISRYREGGLNCQTRPQYNHCGFFILWLKKDRRVLICSIIVNIVVKQ